MTALKDIVFETDHYWVKRVPKGFEVYKTGLTHSTRVAIIGHTGDKGLQRAKLEIERREAATGHATKKKKSSHGKAASSTPSPLGPPRSKVATVIVYSRPSGYWYAQARDATTGARITDATGYSREGVLRELHGKFPMIGVAIESITDEDPYAAEHPSGHATKKRSSAQLDREIAESLSHARHAKKRKRYISLAWSDPTNPDPRRRWEEASYAEDDVPEIFSRLRARGVPEVNVEYTFDFPLTAFSPEQLRDVLREAEARGVRLSQYLRWIARR
jgi:hypothetical protein